MALLTPSAFIAKWLLRFADNTIGAISEAAMREFTQDLNDSAISGKLDKTGVPKISGILEVNSDGTPVPSIYLFSLPGLKNSRTITAIGHNVRPHPSIAGSFLVKTNGVANGGYIEVFCNNFDGVYKAAIPGKAPSNQDQVLTTPELDALLVEAGYTDAKAIAALQPTLNDLAARFKYSILFPNETEVYGDYCNVSETINSITKGPNIATVEYRTDGGAWKNIATGGNMPFTRVAGTMTDYRITFGASAARYGSLIIEGKENI
jgi:hypothetical protein